MKPIRAILVDDEAHARNALRGLLNQNFNHVEIVGEAENIPQAIKLIAQTQPQVVFLDIEMPSYSGTELLDFFHEDARNFHIVFVTAYNEFALKAFELSAVDYLLKPTRPEFVERALRKIDMMSVELRNTSLDTLQSNFKNKELNRIAFQVSDGVMSAAIDDVIFLKADSSYTHIFFRDNSKIMVSKTLMEYNSLEETGIFYRLNRSHIINLRCIDKISRKEGGFVKMCNGHEITATVEQRQKLLKFFEGKVY